MMIRILSRQPTAAIATLTTVASVGLAVLAPSTAAAAEDPTPIHIAGTGDVGAVNIRSSPSVAGAVLGAIPEGASPSYDCFEYGDIVNGVPIWFKVTYNGVIGFYASAFDDSHYQSDADLTQKYGVPKCGSTAAPAGDSSLQETDSGDQLQGSGGNVLPGGTQLDIPVSPFVTDGSQDPFDRSAAKNYAISHAMDDEPFSAGCTYFVSNALFAAGIPENPEWNLNGSHGMIWYLTERPGTPAATAVEPFIAAVMRAYPASTFTSWSMTDNNMPQAEVGDLIAYDWEGDGTYDHLAIITGFSPSDPEYPLVSEWGIYGGTFSSSAAKRTLYTQRGWTWSIKNNSWLQAEHGNANMVAALIHINTTRPSTY